MQVAARRSLLALAVIPLIVLARLVAGQPQSQNPADSDRLRSMLASIPPLDMQRVESRR
jgi:hypothetical protein